MGCLSVASRRVGGLEISSAKLGGLSAESRRVGLVEFASVKVPQAEVASRRVGRLDISSGIVCTIGLGGRFIYLRTSDVVYFLASDGARIRLVDNGNDL